MVIFQDFSGEEDEVIQILEEYLSVQEGIYHFCSLGSLNKFPGWGWIACGEGKEKCSFIKTVIGTCFEKQSFSSKPVSGSNMADQYGYGQVF